MSGCGSRFRSLVFVALALLFAGCGGQQVSTAPTPTVAPANNSTAPPPTRVLQALRIAGHVLDATNAPVPSARVTQWDTANTTMADTNGAFEMTASVTPQDAIYAEHNPGALISPLLGRRRQVFTRERRLQT